MICGYREVKEIKEINIILILCFWFVIIMLIVMFSRLR